MTFNCLQTYSDQYKIYICLVCDNEINKFFEKWTVFCCDLWHKKKFKKIEFVKIIIFIIQVEQNLLDREYSLITLMLHNSLKLSW